MYTSNIVDIFLKALANVCSSAIIAYFPKEDEVSNHIFYPTSETETTSSVEITFVGEHYDLITDKLQADIKQEQIKFEVKAEIPETISKTKTAYVDSEMCIIIDSSDYESNSEGEVMVPLPRQAEELCTNI